MSGRGGVSGKSIRFAAAAIVLLVSLGLLEVGVRSLAAMGLLPGLRRGGADDSFWDGRHPVFGTWHRPSAAGFHKSACFQVTYRTNSVGARDVERSFQSDRRRVVVLGDSMLEGWGLPLDERMTNLLEERTGVEHINLAMSHFGPYQEYLVYATLGRRYAHQAVLIGVNPFNDFYDLDYEVGRHSPGYLYAYRPYLVGTYPEYQRLDYRESDRERWLRQHSEAWNAFSLLWGRFGGPREGFDRPAPFQSAAGIVHSMYYDFTPAQFDLLRFSLEQLVRAADGRKVVVVLLPAPPDFLRYQQSGESPLAVRLEALAGVDGFRFVDLLPPMYRQTDAWENYSFTCDPHWSAYGDAVAAEMLEAKLRGVIY